MPKVIFCDNVVQTFCRLHVCIGIVGLFIRFPQLSSCFEHRCHNGEARTHNYLCALTHQIPSDVLVNLYRKTTREIHKLNRKVQPPHLNHVSFNHLLGTGAFAIMVRLVYIVDWYAMRVLANLVVFRLLPSSKLETHPLLTKGITSGIIAGFGDVLGQSIQSQDSLWEMMRTGRFDIIRTGRFVLLGTFLVGPVCHVWYGSLMQRFPGSSFQRITTRVVLDQFCFAPLFLPTWLLNLWMLQGKSADYVVEEMPRILPEMVINNWKLWIPAQSINLGFVASKYQVLVSNVVAVAWNTYLSITTQPSNTSDTISFLKEEAVEC